MIVNKITTGFVVQKYDTEKRQFISQEFFAGDGIEYEDELGNPVKPFDAYFSFEMKQPKIKYSGWAEK